MLKLQAFQKILLAIVLVVPVQFLCAAPLPDSDRAVILDELKQVQNAYFSKDFDSIVDLMFEPVLNLFGGKKIFAESIRTGLVSLEALGIEGVSSRSLEPGELLDAGEYEVCVVPEENILRVKEKKFRHSSFSIAVRQKGSSEWRLIGGAGLSQNPQILKQVLPDFPDSYQLPKNKFELLSP